jgi:ribosomal-protein-alanine N-acetyltransferase
MMENSFIDIEIRPLSLDDLDSVMDIEPVAFGRHHWSRQSFANELNNPTGNYFAAVNSHINKLVGYSGFWLIGEEAHVTILAVHPDFRRQHIGEQLLLEDILQAKRVGANWITLEVRASNTNAQELYSKYGFKSLGVRRNYYQDNDEDALVLWTEHLSKPEFINVVKSRLSILQELGVVDEKKSRGILQDTFFFNSNVCEISANSHNGDDERFTEPSPLRQSQASILKTHKAGSLTGQSAAAENIGRRALSKEA